MTLSSHSPWVSNFDLHSKRAQSTMGFEYTKSGAGGRGQQLQTLVALLQDDSLPPNPHVGWFTVTFNSILRGSDALFWIPQTPALTHACAHTYTHDQLEVKWIFKYIRNILWEFLLIYVVSTFFFDIAFFIAHTIIFTHIMISRLPQVHQSILWNYISSYNQILYGLLSVYTANKIVFSI